MLKIVASNAAIYLIRKNSNLISSVKLTRKMQLYFSG